MKYIITITTPTREYVSIENDTDAPDGEDVFTEYAVASKNLDGSKSLFVTQEDGKTYIKPSSIEAIKFKIIEE